MPDFKVCVQLTKKSMSFLIGCRQQLLAEDADDILNNDVKLLMIKSNCGNKVSLTSGAAKYNLEKNSTTKKLKIYLRNVVEVVVVVIELSLTFMHAANKP